MRIEALFSCARDKFLIKKHNANVEFAILGYLCNVFN